VREDDDRVAALLSLYCNVVADYKTPPNELLSRHLDKHLKTQMAHLTECRLHCMGMGNLHKELRQVVSRVPPEMSESFAKSFLVDWLHFFFENRIYYARDSIGEKVADHIVKDGDVLLTFGSSPLLRRVLLKIADKRRFRLIIVDCRPLNNGIATLRALSPRISCVYTPLSGLTTVMREATRVVLPATALLTNGSMLGDAGCAMVAAVAKSQRVPVIVLCETYKCSERVQLGSIVFNELGAVSEVAVLEEAPPATADTAQAPAGKAAAATAAAQGPQFVYTPQQFAGYKGALETPPTGAAPVAPYQIYNPRYDCTPIGNISVVATENGLVPPTSIPVIIRELRELNDEGSNAAGGD
jgi:translation initiation factor eIF-2B subunit delta